MCRVPLHIRHKLAECAEAAADQLGVLRLEQIRHLLETRLHEAHLLWVCMLTHVDDSLHAGALDRDWEKV
jgi:hypothetical protein